MPRFEPSIRAPADMQDAAWIYFQRGELWIDEDATVLRAAPDALGVSPVRTVHLGALDGRPCLAAELADGRAPADARFLPLRAALQALPTELFAVPATAAELLHFEDTHRFCSRCGGPLTPSATDRAKRCDACRVDFYPRIAPCVIVVVRDGPRVLLTHVGDRPFWALVAGFLEPGETLEECVAREVREETGIEIDDLRYFGSQPWPFPSQLMVGFLARYAGGEIAVDRNELDEARWFSFEALPPLPPRLSIARRMLEASLAEGGPPARAPSSPVGR
jgi:NAD+ diphosphatase